ncbi:MAG: glycosyltransferase family 4 protein [Candidatus Ranarchaeia archaeon]
MLKFKQAENPINIAFLTWEFPPNALRGVGYVAESLIKKLSTPKLNFTIYTPKFNEQKNRTIESENVKIKYIPIFSDSSRKKFWEKNFEVISYGLGVILEFLHKKNNFLIHGLDWTSILPIITLKKIFNIPTILTFHNSELLRYTNSKDHFLERKVLEKVGIKYIDQTVFVSNKIAESLGVRNKPKIIPNGIDLDLFYPDKDLVNIETPEKWKIGYIGRLVDEKPLTSLINVIERISIKYKITLTIIGDGPNKEKYKKIVKEKGLDKYIIFSNRIKHSEIPSKLKEFHFMIFPTKGETFGLTQVESICCGIPIISPIVPSLENITDTSKIGIILKKLKESEIQKTIELMINKNKWVNLKKKIGKNRIHFSLHKSSNAYVKIYEELTEKRKPLHFKSLSEIPIVPSERFNKDNFAKTIFDLRTQYLDENKIKESKKFVNQFLAIIEFFD